MAKQPAKKKKPQPDHQQIARKVLDAEPAAKKPTKKPARPKNKQDAADRDRANSEGMVQQQSPAKNPAASALGRLGGPKGGKARR